MGEGVPGKLKLHISQAASTFIYYLRFTIYAFFGGQGRNRTADAGLFRAALYQLSYLAIG